MKNEFLFKAIKRKNLKHNAYGVNRVNKSYKSDVYYATDLKSVVSLLEESGENFSHLIWDPAVGGGNIPEVLIHNGYKVRCSDIVDRGYPNTEILDIYSYNDVWYGDIITHPPYKDTLAFLSKCLDIIDNGRKVAMFLKLSFLEGIERRKFFDENPPRTVAVFSKRVACALNGNFKKSSGGAIAYAWYIWEKGYKGKPSIVWIN